MAINPIQSTTPVNTGAGTGYKANGQPTPDPIVSTANVSTAHATSAQTAHAVQPPQEAVSSESVKSAVEALNKFSQSLGAKLNFGTDEETGMTIVKVIDRESDKVIRQIPTEEAVQIAKSLDKLQGLFVNDKA